jgi:diaminopimelate decarboxylase
VRSAPRPRAAEVAAGRYEEIAEAFGTPVYVLDLERLRANYLRFTETVGRFAAPTRVLYSVKTNYLPIVCRALHAWGAGADVVSGYELRAALESGFAGDEIVFNGPVKTAPELELAVRNGVFVNVDGREEVELLAELAPGGRPLEVGLRVQPPEDVYAPGWPVPPRRVPSKFGWPIASGEADEVADLIRSRPELALAGVHCHIGSQITRVAAFAAALESVLAWAARLRERAPLRVLNLGGGFAVGGIHRLRGGGGGLSWIDVPEDGEPEQPFDLDELVDALDDALARQGLADLTVCFEPGRILVSDAMLLLTRVASLKLFAGARWAILDGGLNLIPTAGVNERHVFEAIDGRERPQVRYLVGGPLCYEGDVFSLAVDLPDDLAVSELVAIHDAGAYSVTRANAFNRLRAPVVAVDGSRRELCWRGERFEDVFAPAQETSFEF